MKRIPAFPQWLYEFDVPTAILTQMQEVAQSVNYSPNQTNLNSVVPETVGLPEMVPIREWIDGCLTFVKKDIDYECEELRVNIDWFNRSDKGMWHHAHTHDNAFLSGVVYLSPSNAETIFSIPSIWGPDGTLFNLIHPNNSRVFFSYPTTVGRMLIFPAQVTHSVGEHTFDEPRYTMSFNAFPSGFIGSYSDKHYRKFMNITVHQEK